LVYYLQDGMFIWEFLVPGGQKFVFHVSYYPFEEVLTDLINSKIFFRVNRGTNGGAGITYSGSDSLNEQIYFLPEQSIMMKLDTY
jgi:hypothetical protein